MFTDCGVMTQAKKKKKALGLTCKRTEREGLQQVSMSHEGEEGNNKDRGWMTPLQEELELMGGSERAFCDIQSTLETLEKGFSANLRYFLTLMLSLIHAKVRYFPA